MHELNIINSLFVSPGNLNLKKQLLSKSLNIFDFWKMSDLRMVTLDKLYQPDRWPLDKIPRQKFHHTDIKTDKIRPHKDICGF